MKKHPKKINDAVWFSSRKVILLVLSLLFITTASFSQNEANLRKISGTVTDSQTGESLIGVSVIVKGASQGTITNLNGQFNLQVPKSTTLVLSYVGYVPQEIQIKTQSTLNISLSQDTKKLEEVVVVGYGKQKKIDLTGSVASANIEDFKNSPNTNIVQSLQGSIPGLNVGQVTTAGSTPSISIRGKNTISGNANVLIILDGIQYNSSLSSINPDDIASIDVLKDASSTAVYGAQAANGVLLITTRKGTNNQKPKVSFSSSYTTQTPTVNLRPMEMPEYLDHVRDLNWDKAYLANGAPDPSFNVTKYVDASMKDASGNLLTNNFDWWKAATKAGYILENQLSVTGGGEKINYLISAGMTDQSGFIMNDKFKRNSLRVNVETQATSWWKLGVQSFGSFVNSDGAEPNLGTIMVQSPLLTPFDSNGDVIPYPFNTKDENPFMTYYVNDYERHNYLFANIYSELTLPFIKGLKYRFNYGNNYRLDKHYYASQYAGGLTGEAFKEDTQYNDYTFDNILSYDNSFGKHTISATFLYGAVERDNSYTKADAVGFSRITLGYNSLQSGTNQYTTSNAWQETMNYQMGRLNYKFADKYLLTTTIRRDGYSGFSANNKYAYFPSVALGWILSEESFFKVKWVDLLKIRSGYGVSGNQTSRYKSLATVVTSNAYVFGDGGTTQIGQELNALSNNNLKWEKTTGLNLGIDFRLLKSRLIGSVDLYKNITNDLLFDVAIPNITGFSSISSNVGKLQNSGIEVNLTSVNFENKKFRWSSTASFSTNTNKIVSLTGSGDMISSNLFIGKSIGAVYGYQTNGIYQLGEIAPSGYYPGTYRIVNQNDDNVINTNDRIILGHTEPAYRIGFLNKFECMGFTLSVFLNSIQGGKNGYLGVNSPATSKSDNTIRWNDISGIDYWSPANPNGKYPRFVSSPAIAPTVYQDRSFIRLQDISLSYQFKGSLLKTLNMQNLTLYVSGKNLATWTKWEGWDPEAGQGLTTGGRPVMKGYSVGINVTF
jgi:TonB-dependent starch-binding outer membrane protein SusC